MIAVSLHGLDLATRKYRGNLSAERSSRSFGMAAASRRFMANSRMNRPPKRGHREQVNELVDTDEARPLEVRPLADTDRLHNPDDISVDQQAIAAGVQHGGTLETRAEALRVRGSGGRKRAGMRGNHQGGRDISKPRR